MILTNTQNRETQVSETEQFLYRTTLYQRSLSLILYPQPCIFRSVYDYYNTYKKEPKTIVSYKEPHLNQRSFSLSLLYLGCRKIYRISGSSKIMPEMKMDEYTCIVEGKMISFYHDKKTHRMIILTDYEPYETTLQRGLAIIDFLKHIKCKEIK